MKKLTLIEHLVIFIKRQKKPIFILIYGEDKDSENIKAITDLIVPKYSNIKYLPIMDKISKPYKSLCGMNLDNSPPIMIGMNQSAKMIAYSRDNFEDVMDAVLIASNPSLLKKIFYFLDFCQAFFKSILHDRKILTPKNMKEYRINKCLSCPYNTGKDKLGKCTQCGCALDLKVKFKVSKCPINSW